MTLCTWLRAFLWLTRQKLNNCLFFVRKAPLATRKIQLCPRFIHFDELCLLSFLSHFFEGGNPLSCHIEQLTRTFSEINNLDGTLPLLESNIDVCNDINLHQLSAPNCSQKLSPGVLKIPSNSWAQLSYI